MGSDALTGRNNSFAKRDADHNRLYNAIHRARVTEIFIDEGRVAVTLENVAYSATVTIPLLGLSAPPSAVNPSEADFSSSSWGRYIPQIGDLLLVGFGSNGDLYALGYSAIFYRGMDVADVDNESTGGIGWGETSAKTLNPGDWDFKSSRNSTLYLGDKVSIASGPYSIDLNQATDDITITTPLLIGSFGTSRMLLGMVERFVLPTDDEPTAIPSPRAGTTAQEATFKVRWNGGPTDGQELATLSMGDVIDDDGSTASIRLSGATVPQPVRRYFNSVDNTGYITSYTEMVDAGGNYEVTASTATDFQWSTIAATWKINNLKTEWTSLEGIDLNCTTILNLVGTGGVVIDSSGIIQLGGSTASEPMVLGTKWNSFINALIGALVSHTHPVTGANTGPSADFTTASVNLVIQAAQSLSQKVLGS